MYQSSDSVQVATSAPLLRAVLILVVILAAVGGVLVVGSSQIGWAALGFSVVAGPLAVIAEGRSRAARRPTEPSRAAVAPQQPELNRHPAQVRGRPGLVVHREAEIPKDRPGAP